MIGFVLRKKKATYQGLLGCLRIKKAPVDVTDAYAKFFYAIKINLYLNKCLTVLSLGLIWMLCQ